jgi:hypothetical protein
MSTKRAKQALARAIDRITPQRQWARLTLARDEIGTACTPLSQHARSWCALGAIDKEVDGDSRLKGEVYALLAEVDNTGVAKTNDYQGHEAVLKLLTPLVK